jgi:hypothetical protein
VTISAFCWHCCVRRGPVTTMTTRTDYRLGCTFQTSHWENPCGHVDTDERIISEAELACAAAGCVVMTSDMFYPYCSPECGLADTR